ncbi:hypothetical protein WMY93_027150 [Mugilogobius chulae]|uniref:EF-hand domain-containing protein n=1 Tax=Mugilogobius chulae TaxID=88201 RepID=A0AAW0MY09_9GOBI
MSSRKSSRLSQTLKYSTATADKPGPPAKGAFSLDRSKSQIAKEEQVREGKTTAEQTKEEQFKEAIEEFWKKPQRKQLLESVDKPQFPSTAGTSKWRLGYMVEKCMSSMLMGTQMVKLRGGSRAWCALLPGRAQVLHSLETVTQKRESKDFHRLSARVCEGKQSEIFQRYSEGSFDPNCCLACTTESTWRAWTWCAQTFTEADKNGDGSLSISEVLQLLHKLNVNLPRQKVKQMFKVKDYHSHTVTTPHLLHHLLPPPRHPPPPTSPHLHLRTTPPPTSPHLHLLHHTSTTAPHLTHSTPPPTAPHLHHSPHLHLLYHTSTHTSTTAPHLHPPAPHLHPHLHPLHHTSPHLRPLHHTSTHCTTPPPTAPHLHPLHHTSATAPHLHPLYHTSTYCTTPPPTAPHLHPHLHLLYHTSTYTSAHCTTPPPTAPHLHPHLHTTAPHLHLHLHLHLLYHTPLTH